MCSGVRQWSEAEFSDSYQTLGWALGLLRDRRPRNTLSNTLVGPLLDSGSKAWQVGVRKWGSPIRLSEDVAIMR